MAVKYVKDFVFEQPRGFTGSVSHKKPPGMKKDLAPSKPFKGEYQGYAKGGMVKTLDKMMRERRSEMPVRAAASVRGMPAAARPNAPARPMADRMESRPTMGRGQGYAAGGEVKKGAKDSVEYIKRGIASGLKPGTAAFSKYIANMPVFPSYKPKNKLPMPESESDSAYMRPKKMGESSVYEEDLPSAMKREATGYAKGGMAKGKAKVAKVMGEYKRGELHSGSKKGPKVKSREQAVAIALSEARKAGAKIPKKAEGGGIYSTEYMAYGDKKGPYRGSPKKAKMLGRQDRRAREAMERAEKHAPGLSLDMPGKKMEKYAHGGMAKGGFPDLTGDGKVTRADVLKGRGVFKKGGMAVHRRKPMYGGGKC